MRALCLGNDATASPTDQHQYILNRVMVLLLGDVSGVIRQREDFWRIRTSKEGSCLDRLDFTPISNSTTSGHTRTRKPLEKTDVRGWHSEFVHVGRGSHVHASLSWRFPRVRGREVNHRRIVQ